jgi:hypothetical protein
VLVRVCAKILLAEEEKKCPTPETILQKNARFCSEVVIENTGNSNVLGNSPSLPDFDWDFDFGGMNWLLTWGWFGAHMG